jgi:prepilin peptidase CpaA
VSAPALAAALVLGALAAAGAYLDLRYRRLPNWLCAAALFAGIGAGLAVHDGAWVGMALLHALVALLVGMALFAGRVIGAGDAKFYAAIAAWLPLEHGLVLLSAVSLSGLAVLAAWFPARRRVASAIGSAANADDFKKVPYGIAIALGGLIAYLVTSSGSPLAL